MTASGCVGKRCQRAIIMVSGRVRASGARRKERNGGDVADAVAKRQALMASTYEKNWHMGLHGCYF